ncbi:transposase [Scytonema sp. NUACC26]|uniref:transposase n=1 Tax=Scytonema sp. NUACC26 TaxID=3140176 RepID=UPI0034DC560D
MSKRKPKNIVQKFSTQVVEIVSVSSETQTELLDIMERLGVVRAESYNKLGSVRHWGMDWRQAYPEVRSFRTPQSLGLPSKLMEWTVSDVAKAILAQQAATVANLRALIYQRSPGIEHESTRKECYEKLKSPAFLEDSFLHRIVRKEFQRGHTKTSNQIVYQPNGYSCTRVSRYKYKLEISGLTKGKRIALTVKSNRKITGQIRVIHNRDLERFEIHFLVNFGELSIDPKAVKTEIGIDKGYTEAFYDSRGQVHGEGLGELLTQKSNRITKKNRNRGKLFALFNKVRPHDSAKAARILENNLTRKTENKRERQDTSAIASLIGRASKSLFKGGSLKVFAEDLTQPIKNKRQSKAMSRKLNSWVKGYLRDSLEKWASWSNSTISEVAASYTSQVDKGDGSPFRET